MRKVLSKRIMAMMLALVLCLSGSFVMPVNAEASTEVPAETSLEDGISLASEDITPPVVSNVQLVENGTELTKDANGNMYIHFTFDAYDADGSAISAEKSRVTVFPGDSMLALGTPITELKEVSDGSYEMTCSVDNVRNSAPSTGDMYVAAMTISDEKGNGYDVTCVTNGSKNYTFSIAEIYSEDFIIDTITLDKTAINLTDTVLSEELLMTMTLKSIPAALDTTNSIVAQFKHEDGSSVSFYLGYAGENIYTTRNNLSYFLSTGTYKLSSIALQSTGEKLKIPETVSFVVNKSNTDTTAPVVNELYCTVNGEKLTAGAVVEKTDTVKVHMKATDVSGMDDNLSAWVNFKTDLQDASQNMYSRNLTYDAVTDEFVCDVPVDEMYATEWYISGYTVRDVYHNLYYLDIWDYKQGTVNILDQYFIIRSENGNVSIPTYNYKIAFNDCANGGWQEYNVSSGRITTLQEAMASVNGMIPEPQEYEGRIFEGWYLDNAVIEPDEKIRVSGNDMYMVLAPKYDKAPVTVEVMYYGGTDSPEWDSKTIEIDADYGDSIKEIYDNLDLSSIAHNVEMRFDSWEHYGMFYEDFTDEVITPYNYSGGLEAKYKCTPVWISLNYSGVDMKDVWKAFAVCAEIGVDTYQDALDKALTKKKMNHCKDLTLTGWTCDLDSATLSKTVEEDDGIAISAKAKYSVPAVSVQVQYIDENGEFAYWDKNVAVPSGSTYQDVYDKIQSDLSVKHSANHKFTGWELTNAENDKYTDTVGSQYAYMTLRAEYETYPVTYKYSYLTKDHEMKTVSKESVVDAGTNLLDYFENLTLPADALVEDEMQWTFVNVWNLDEVNIANMDVYGALEYENYIPTATTINALDGNHNSYAEDKVYYIYSEYNVDQLSNFWLAQQVFGDDLLELVKADATIPCPSDFTVDEYIWNYTNFYRDTVDANGKYKNTVNSSVYIAYDKTVVTYIYPDGKVVKEVKTADVSITLPATYNNQTVVWFADGYVYECDLVGGDVVKAESPYVELSAYYLGGSAVAPSTPVTPSPAPVTPSPAPVIPAEPEASEETKADTKTETETTTEETEEVEEVVAVKLDETVVEEKVEVVKEAEEGTAVVVEMKKEDGEVATEVPVEILEAAQGKNVDVVLDMGGYTWTINGQDIPSAAELKAINLEVTLDTEVVPPTAISAVAGEQPTRQISLTHNGDFGFKASLSINVGSENSGQYGNLYYYDSNNKLVFMNAGLIDDDGNVQLSFSHASDYIVVVDKDRTEDEAQKEEGGVIEDVTTPDLDEDSQTSDVDTNSNTDSGSSVSTFILVVAIILVVVGAAILVAFVVMKKKEE